MRRRHAAVAVASAVAMAAAAPAHHRIPRILVQTHDYPTATARAEIRARRLATHRRANTWSQRSRSRRRQVADAPPETRAVMRGLRDDNPSWEHLYFNATAMVQFIQTHFPGRVARAYGLLNAEYGAARADFFRLCFMYRARADKLVLASTEYPRGTRGGGATRSLGFGGPPSARPSRCRRDPSADDPRGFKRTTPDAAKIIEVGLRLSAGTRAAASTST